ncbi:MAG: aminotransferase class I/II-fold pyridoxal phosphate-dependent enzyme [Methylococcales bacterium]|nr:aminotransferase class I/II-fold pyridoxal phosphate-dependent enzyme [Methylococcales bacterium]
MNVLDKCYGFQRAHAAKKAGYYPYFIPLDENEGTEASYKGHRLGMIGSNNYLGLTTDSRVKVAAQEAIEKYGSSCTGARFLNGTLALHEELEEELAELVNKEAALVFGNGYQVNLGVISSLLGRRDVAIIDHDDHASIIDGCRLSVGETRRFHHNDLDHLDHVLRTCSEGVGKLVIVEGVYSMGGDIAPLPEIVELCQKHNAQLMVDDAHGIGVIGEGRGTAAHFGVSDGVDLIMGTFSKSLASLGGFIAGDAQVIHYIKHFARTMIFSASVTPPNAAAALAAVRIIREEPHRIKRLAEVSERMKKEFTDMGLDVGNTETPIVPIILGDEMTTLGMWRALFDAGIFANAVIPPAVSPNASRLRTSYMATHTDEQLDMVVNTFREVLSKANGLEASGFV